MTQKKYCEEAKILVDSVRGKTLSPEERCQTAIALAALIMRESLEIQTHAERIHQNKLNQLIGDIKGKVFTASFTDCCFRSRSYIRTADQLIYIIKKFGIPPFLSWYDKLAMTIFKILGKTLGAPFIPFIQNLIRKETSQVILSTETEKLSKHLEERRLDNITVNLNELGEAILGEEEAEEKLRVYLKDLSNSEIEYISIKISTLYSQINLTAPSDTLERVSNRLRRLYRAARENSCTSASGEKKQKFVNLDMEEYKDLQLTLDLFKQVLSEPEFHQLSAGIVLQSYLPNSYPIQQDLTAWALQRVQQGGAPIKIRLVKGANLAMEQIEASLHGWPQAPFANKVDVDANFKKMLAYGSIPEHARAVHLGIGSHNLFDISYALLLRSENQIEDFVEFEMLEGMADPMRRALQKLVGKMLLYCPIASPEGFQYAVAYLSRRLDENTASDNFLRYAFSLIPESDEWHKQALIFAMSCDEMNKVKNEIRRVQNRFESPLALEECALFDNEPDTDWSLIQNNLWGTEILETWKNRQHETIPLVVQGENIFNSGSEDIGRDPSFPEKGLYRYTLATIKEIEKAISGAQKAFQTWSKTSIGERSNKLRATAQALRCNRASLIGAMVADVGKTLSEADSEVSEAIDFAEYYSRNLDELQGLQDIRWHSKGVVLVAPPWNFPCSIPAGGILAALAAGNSVIFKPAPEAVLVGWHLVQALWEAGIGKDVLQFVACEDEPVGSALITDPRINCIVLTGGTATAQAFMKMRPGLDLLAETGGKNSMIVTAMSDRDLAIKDTVQSAFGYAGQKCSACSLLILEKEVYDDPKFMKSLKDAAASLHVGSPWDPNTKINPLIRLPNPALEKSIGTLEEGESWLVEPRPDPRNPQLWSPGIKLGVKQGNFTYQNELFGPVLGVMRANNLEHAVQLANGTPYGLTAGLHSLDEREHKYWMERIQAGNCYINRGITGAIVQRQPFGGCKKSNFGPGAKAGGPNYLMQLMRAEQIALPTDLEALAPDLQMLNSYFEKRNDNSKNLSLWKSSVGSYAFYWKHYFQKNHDPSCLLGQDNLFHYTPYAQQTLRIQEQDQRIDVFRAIAAAATCGSALEISCSPEKIKNWVDGDWRTKFPKITFQAESEKQFCERVSKGKILRIRTLSEPTNAATNVAAEAGVTLIHAPVFANGRLELLHYLREVCFSIDYHRYGYLGIREGEKRKPLPEPHKAKLSQECGQLQCCKA